MIEPTIDDIGRAVVYMRNQIVPAEEGIITSFNEFYVFVRYKGDTHSKATRRDDLRWSDDASLRPRRR